jgi:hypothetical protein
MSSPGRSSLVYLGVLTVLSAGAIALSLATAPPVAEQQLHIGSGSTAGVGSFVMDLVNTFTTQGAGPGGASQVQRGTQHIVYQAPDRFHEMISSGRGQGIDIIVVGSQRYQRKSPRLWTQLPSGATDIGLSAVNSLVLLPANTAAKGTPVTRHGQTSNSVYAYGLPPGPLAVVDAKLFGAGAGVIARHAFTVTIDKEFMVSQTFLATAGNQADRITVRYSELGTAPPVTPPPTSALH